MIALIRVLIVDDSAFARKVLREVLTQSPQIEVCGIARDGLEALEKFAELKPDVVTLDLVMPNLDGLGVLDALSKEDRARVVLVSTASSESDLAMAALERGAFDLVNKPTALATARLYELGSELILKIKGAAHALSPGEETAAVVESRPPAPGPRKLLVIGTSTGGPQALTRLLTSLPANFPLPIVVALHIPAGYTDALARRLDNASALEIVEADNGVELRPGRAVIARGGSHLRVQTVDGSLVVYLSSTPSDAVYFPSVDVLFASAVEQCGSGVVGVVLTGMGNDGQKGAELIHRAGGLVITEAASSCVVYGMPRAVAEAGLSHAQVSLETLSQYLQTRI